MAGLTPRRRARLGLAVCFALASTSAADRTVSIRWQQRDNINATVSAGDTVEWVWADAFPQTLQKTGIQNTTIFTGPGTGECGRENKTAPFSYKIQVNVPGKFTYNDGCSPNITLGLLQVLPLPLFGPPANISVTTTNTSNAPPVWNTTTLISNPPPAKAMTTTMGLAP